MILKALRRYSGQIYVIFTLALVTILGGGVVDVWHVFLGLQAPWLIASAALWLLHLLLRGIMLMYYIRRQGYQLKLYDAISTAIIGLYYSGITPASTGGQPMQLYRLHKVGIPVSISASVVTIKFFCFQLVVISMGIILWLACMPLVNSILGGAIWMPLMGFAINGGIVAVLLLFLIQKNLVRRFINWLIRIGGRLKLIRSTDKLLSNTEHSLESFYGSMKMLFRSPLDAFIMLALATVQAGCLMAIVACLYYSFGLNAVGFWGLTALQTLLYLTVAFIPTPGASGGQEGGFYIFFRGVFPDGSVAAAILIWRFFTYYLTLIIGAAFIVGENIFLKKKVKT